MSVTATPVIDAFASATESGPGILSTFTLTSASNLRPSVSRRSFTYPSGLTDAMSGAFCSVGSCLAGVTAFGSVDSDGAYSSPRPLQQRRAILIVWSGPW